MQCSNPDVNPDLVKDPLLEPYNLDPGALDPQEIECWHSRRKQAKHVDICN